MKKKLVFLWAAAFLSLAVGAADPVTPKRTAPEAQGDVTGKMFEALGIPKNQVREAWNTPELKYCAARWHEVTLLYENGHVGIYEVWDRELAALRALMSQPEVAASPLMPELIRAYSKRLKQQLDMLKLEYESGFRGLETVRKKEFEIAEYRKKWGLPENERDMNLSLRRKNISSAEPGNGALPGRTR